MRRALRGGLFALAGLLAVACVLGALLLARGRALADERVMDAGAQLLSYARAIAPDAPRTLIVNGLPVHVVSGTTRDGVSTLLDTFHARCRRSSAGLDRLPHQRPGGRRWPRIAEHALDPVLRHDDAHGGYVACLDLGAEPVPPQDLLERVRRFLRSSDLAEVGDVRFAWAFRGETATTYVGVYTQGAVPLSTLFPTHGDAPGTDVLGVPRPAHGRRVLSAFQRDASPMLASYESAEPPRVALQAFAKQLAKSGLQVSALAGVDDALRVSGVRGEPGVLAFAKEATRGKTLLTVLRLH